MPAQADLDAVQGALNTAGDYVAGAGVVGGAVASVSNAAGNPAQLAGAVPGIGQVADAANGKFKRPLSLNNVL